MFFRRHLFIVILGVVVLVAAFSVLLAAHVVSVEGVRFVFQGGNIRVSTVITAIFCFVLVLFMQKRIFWKPLYYGLLAVIFFLALYEIIWYYLAAFSFGYDLRLFQFAALAGWVLLCFREVFSVKPPKVSLVLYGLFVIALLLWVATGFEVNTYGDAKFSVVGEIFNVVSKAALALAYAVHIGTKTG
jgi:hypothetical protein